MPEPIVQFEKVAFRYDSAKRFTSFVHAEPRGDCGAARAERRREDDHHQDHRGHSGGQFGAVSVCGLPLPEQAIGVKQRIGYVPESAMLFESLTGQEFLELCGRLHDVEEDALQARIRSMLETFSLVSDRVARLDTYSKGMRQKILIGAALVHDPDLILLDEPLSGLDVNAAILVKDLLAALAAAGRPWCTARTCWTWWRDLRPRAHHPPGALLAESTAEAPEVGDASGDARRYFPPTHHTPRLRTPAWRASSRRCAS